ncbi:MAG: ETC complex I subunit [Pseudobdellovibrionaceae bacterium]
MEVKIYRPSRSTMQSGRAKTEGWVLEYELKTPRRPENLMGWTSSGDTLNQVRLNFPLQESAVEFAKKKGWDYTVLPEHDRIVRPRNYVDNFKYIPPEDVAS